MSMEYRLKNKEWSCIISPKFGSNVISLRHNEYPIFREPKSLEELSRSPVLYGLPLLLPPNRTAGGRFMFDGHEYCLHEDKTLTKNYIHGEVKSTPFEVLQYTGDLLKTRLINRGEVFPFPFELEITDRLLDDGFHRDLTVKNIGITDMPLVLGFHTSFTVPDSFSVAIGERWVGDENFIPTGEKRELTPQQQMLPHTGQNYRIGDANVWFLASIDDTIHYSQSINHTCLMFMMDLGGQRIFFTADGSFSDARLPERYGNELKADIMQVPHHGFGSGDDDVQIQGFRLVAPRTCLLPVELRTAYTSFTTYRPGTNYLMTRLDIDELLTGEKEHVLPLPYSPDPAEAFTYRQRYLEGRDNSGARTWIFTDLNTGRKEDFIFSVFNGTFYNARLQVELFFENVKNKPVTIQNQCLRRGTFRLNCLLCPEEDQSRFDESDFLEALGIPENTYFTVRFISDLPIVVSHRDHTPAYRSTIV